VSSRRITALVAAAASSLVAAAPAAAAAPVVQQMVVGKDGSARKIGTVRASATRVKVGSKRCAVGAGTPLAALARGKVGTLRFTDFGSCGRRARDAGGLYVRGIGRDVVSGPEDPDGWVYKVGNKAAPAGSGDPSGPFGHGLLKSKQRVLWFWCVSLPVGDGCQRTLELKVDGVATKEQIVHVTGYDNAGKGVPVEGVTVSSQAGAAGTTDASGRATLFLGAGTNTLVATKDGLVRSFPVRVDIPE
jgi:hypothetical protein